MNNILIYLKTTETCNLNCKHCFTNGTNGAKIYWNTDLVIDWIKRYNTHTPKLDSIHFEFHGGEPFLVPVSEMKEVYNSCNGLWDNMSWGATSNLVFKMDEDHIQFIKNELENRVGTSWDPKIRFANTLRLRLSIRISGVEPALAKSNAEAAVAGGVMETNAHDAYIKTTANNINSMNQATAWNEFRMSAAMESVLTGYEDPRITKMYAPISGTTATYKGIRNGYTQVELGLPANENTKLSNVNDRFTPANQNTNPFEVIMSTEAWFLRAEGVLKGWNMGGGTAKTYYEKGIEISMKQWGIADAAAIAAYTASAKTPIAVTGAVVSPALTNIPVAFSADATKQLEQVITQKWIALWPNGAEAWTEYRRTGFPKLYPRMNSESLFVTKDQVVRRVPYTIGETQTNAAGLATGVAKLGGADNEATRLWWNK